MGLDRTREAAETASGGGGWRLLFWIVFARSDNPMALLTPDRRFIAINRAGVTLIGYRREEIIGRRIESVVVPEQSRSVDAEWRELERRGDFEGERTILTADGQRVMVQYAMRSVRLNGRDVVLVVLLGSSLEPIRTTTAGSWQASMLSPREIEIVSHVAMGQRAHEIAEDLDIAESTVKTHLRNAMRKVGARSQAQLVALVCSGQVPSATVPSGTYFGR